MIEHISRPTDPRIDDYRNVPDAELLSHKGLFMAEGRLVICTLLTQSRFRVRSLLLTPPAHESVRKELAQIEPAPKVFVADQAVMDQITGFHIHRGALAAGERNQAIGAADLTELVGRRAPIVVLEDLTNHDNVGGIFRNVHALGGAGVLLSPRCCDPLYRKAIRVSMGAALRVPFARARRWPGDLDALESAGYVLIGVTPGSEAVELDEFVGQLDPALRLALVLGSEGPGLSRSVLDRCEHHVCISMIPGVDSLNVATATGIMLHALGRVRRVR